MSMLFFHFDGTDNSPNDAFAPAHSVSSITNVLKSHLLLGGQLQPQTNSAPTHSPHRSFYYAGIGTYGSWLEQKLNAAFAIESGHVAKILNRAINDFKNHYNQSINHIVLIGFSRGAALARRFASLISPLIDRSIIIEAVIDTVASIGWPNLDITKRPTTDVVFEHGNTLPDGVHRALHLVALDEQRLAFRPTLINHDGRALEIWLAGVHSDIGGGYRKDGIGDIALRCLNRLDRTTHPTELLPQSDTQTHRTTQLANTANPRAQAPRQNTLSTSPLTRLARAHASTTRLLCTGKRPTQPSPITQLAPKRCSAHPQQHWLLPYRTLPNTRHTLALQTIKPLIHHITRRPDEGGTTVIRQ
ncbi:MAG: T6SS phospholipase effector Tle1-like catalytic domain-containing protein [Marinomonas foliarum]